jgi:hypothetical protein
MDVIALAGENPRFYMISDYFVLEIEFEAPGRPYFHSLFIGVSSKKWEPIEE